MRPHVLNPTIFRPKRDDGDGDGDDDDHDDNDDDDVDLPKSY